MANIDSKDITVGKLFDDFYVVPSYQREYVWGTKQVTDFFQDIFDAFSSNDSEHDSEYFIGNIIVCSRRDGVYELIDGQQRMTTAYLFLCSIRDCLYKIDQNDRILEGIRNKIAASDISAEGEAIYRYRLAVEYEKSGGILEKIARQEKLVDIPKSRSVKNIRNAFDIIMKCLKKLEIDSSGIQNLKKFYAYFLKNVKVVRVTTASVASALKVFATINNRGVSLDDMDLLKNLMFMKAKEKEYKSIQSKWKKMVDILYVAGEKPMRFLRYFIIAQYDVEQSKLREDEIYNWFVTNEDKCGYQKKPVDFVDNLLKSARAYDNFLKGKDVNGNPNRYLANISYLSSASRQHLMLLLASQHLPTDCFIELSRYLENLLFAYLLTNEPTNKFENQFAQWTKELRKINDKTTLDSFINHYIQPVKDKLAERFELEFNKLDESSVPKYQMRYILAKLTQYIDELAWGSSDDTVDLKHYVKGKFLEIEHILPQDPTEEILSSFDRPKEIEKYIKLLGNLTLLEKSINASIGNKPFQEKKKEYQKSKYLISRTIAEKVNMGNNTAINRAVQDLETFEEWTSQSIEGRQKMLAQLAKKVWDMAVKN